MFLELCIPPRALLRVPEKMCSWNSVLIGLYSKSSVFPEICVPGTLFSEFCISGARCSWSFVFPELYVKKFCVPGALYSRTELRALFLSVLPGRCSVSGAPLCSRGSVFRPPAKLCQGWSPTLNKRLLYTRLHNCSDLNRNK